MRIAINPGREAQVAVYSLYVGDNAVVPVKDARAKAGAATWYHARAEGEAEILTVGLGERAAGGGTEVIRRAGGIAARNVAREGWRTAVLHRPAPEPALAEDAASWLQAWVEGWLLGLYRFAKYKQAGADSGSGDAERDCSGGDNAERDGSGNRGVELSIPAEEWPSLNLSELEHAISNARIRAEGAMLAKDLVNDTPDALNPDTFVDRVVAHFANQPVQVKVYRGQELVDRQMNGLLAVGSGSWHKPALIEIRYEGNSSLPLLALVGKGITFDMGGMNVKTARDISDARMDMGGAAAVIGAMDILVKQGAKANVVALIAVADNLPDAAAMLPSSVIRYPNGLSVQVANTDGEGRLVLADALLHAAKLGATEAIDIATLTGNVGQALGLELAGIWGHGGMTEQLVAIGERNGERLWPMPLVDEYESELRSDYADLRNVGTSTLAGAITAALFIRRFVAPTMKWVHIDMAGTVQYKRDVGYAPAGATGYGARLLADYAVGALGLAADGRGNGT